jgi:hypothetical protein
MASAYDLSQIAKHNPLLAMILSHPHWIDFENVHIKTTEFFHALQAALSAPENSADQQKSTIFLKLKFHEYLSNVEIALSQPDHDQKPMDCVDDLDTLTSKRIKSQLNPNYSKLVDQATKPIFDAARQLAEAEQRVNYLTLHQEKGHIPHSLKSKWNLSTPKFYDPDQKASADAIVAASQARQKLEEIQRLNDCIEITKITVADKKKVFEHARDKQFKFVQQQTKQFLDQFLKIKSANSKFTQAQVSRIYQLSDDHLQNLWNTKLENLISNIRLKIQMEESEKLAFTEQKWKLESEIKAKEDLLNSSVPDQRLHEIQENLFNKIEDKIQSNITKKLAELNIQSSSRKSRSRSRSTSKSRSRSRSRSTSRSKSRGSSHSRSRSRSHSRSRPSKSKQSSSRTEKSVRFKNKHENPRRHSSKK